MEELHSSETLDHTRTTWCNILHNILHSHCRENLKSYSEQYVWKSHYNPCSVIPSWCLPPFRVHDQIVITHQQLQFCQFGHHLWQEVESIICPSHSSMSHLYVFYIIHQLSICTLLCYSSTCIVHGKIYCICTVYATYTIAVASSYWEQ
jgi:hypothetical protein